MDERPEIVFFAQNKIGGVQTFYENLIRYPQTDADLKWILVEKEGDADARPFVPFNLEHEIFFIEKTESTYAYASRLHALVSSRPGAVVTNFRPELSMLHLHRKKNKTIYYICHDEVYLLHAKEYDFLIDVFIAHNPVFQEKLTALLPHRARDIYFIPFGIVPRTVVGRQPNLDRPLRLLFLARLHEKKGIHSLLPIDALLKAAGTRVQWTVIGNGPENERFAASIAGNPDFVLHTSLSNEAIIPYFARNDLFILPSSLDGVPLAMMETMSAGLVPVIYRFNDGIGKMFGEYSFITPVGDEAALAGSIIKLDQDRNLLASYSVRCASLIQEKYEVNIRNREYYNLFGRFRELKKRARYKIPDYGGYLEHPMIPQVVKKIIRVLKGKKRNTDH